MPSPRSRRGAGIRAANRAPGGLLDKAAIATMPVPVVGDAVGLLSDAAAFIDEPSVGNAAMGLLGAVPFVPAGAVKRAAVRFPGEGRGPIVGRGGGLLSPARFSDTAITGQFNRADNAIELNRDAWKQMSSDERLALLRHEEGHAAVSKFPKMDRSIAGFAEDNRDAIRRFMESEPSRSSLRADDGVFAYQAAAEEMIADYWSDLRNGADLDRWRDLGVKDKLDEIISGIR